MKGQLSLFESTMTKASAEVRKDVRTEQQKKNKVSYDVGEKIGGAKKDVYTLKQHFLHSHKEEVLKTLESLDKRTAAEIITKDELFKHFSLYDEKERGVNVSVAKFKQLIIRRIDKSPVDSEISRMKYLQASVALREMLDKIITRDELYGLIHKLNRYLIDESLNKEYYTEMLERVKIRMVDCKKTDPDFSRLMNKRNRYKQIVERSEEALSYSFSSLGKSFVKMFTNRNSLNSSLSSAEKVQDWNELLKSKTKGTQIQKKNKPVWERKTPERPDRINGAKVDIQQPEDLRALLNLKGIQFGHYVGDEKAREHIFKCAEAFYDLADMLGVDSPSKLSLNGTLSLAFGARGSGRALGHYEPLHRIINFTKDKGTLGILAHEWFHALDNYIGSKSHNFMNGKPSYLSDIDTVGDNISVGVKKAMRELIKSIVDGESLEYLSNGNSVNTKWTIPAKFKFIYKRNLDETLDIESLTEDVYRVFADHKHNLEDSGLLNTRRENKIKRDYEKAMQALVWYHEKETGERIEYIPIISTNTKFFNRSIGLDRGSVGKYWSSYRELTARVFESYIEEKLINSSRKSDYLVCGTNDEVAYPSNQEKTMMFNRMDSLIKEIVQELFL